jgi:hypothetical protein
VINDELDDDGINSFEIFEEFSQDLFKILLFASLITSNG